LVAFALLLATAQAPDRLWLNGKEFFIHTNPLEPFLEVNPTARPKPELISTCNWRGYIATWEVRDDHLILIDIDVLGLSREAAENESIGDVWKRRSVMSSVFPDRKEVLADWFSGHVIVPHGECIDYVHQGYASTYENHIILRVDWGLVTRRWDLDLDGFLRFRDAQFDQFKRTEEYRTKLSQLSDAPGKSEIVWNEDQKEQFLRQFYSERYMSLIFDALQ